LISTVVMLQAQDRETINSTSEVVVSFKIIMTTSVTRPCFTKQHQTARPKPRPQCTISRPKPRPQRAIPRPRPRPIFWSQTGLILRPTVSDHIAGLMVILRELCTS